MKVRAKQLSDQERMETLDALYTAAGVLQGRDAMKHFLRDLLTEGERIMLGRRILIARSLLAGATYDEIAAELRVGKDTIGRVDKWLMGKSVGYEEAIYKMRAEMRRRGDKRRAGSMYRDNTAAGQFARMKKKYPLHFLLFPWPKKYKHTRK